MAGVAWHDLDDGITCIDANYTEWGMACFYLLEAGGEYALVETGTNHSLINLQALMKERGIAPEAVRYVIPTHVHLDHAGGAGAMMVCFANAKLLIHPRGARHMADPTKLVGASQAVYGAETFAKLYGEVVAVESDRIREMADGDAVELGGRRLEMRHTEGHARHHFCVWDETSRGWFSGDMFGLCYPWFRFEGGDYLMPSTTPSQFDPQAYLASLALLDSYQPERVYLTHYGAIDYSAAKSQLLASQVEAYSELAMVAGAGLEDQLGAYALGQILEFASATPETELRRMLRFDVELNAQGLALWAQQARDS